MKKKWLKTLVVTGILTSFAVGGKLAHADTINFSVNPIIPSNQANPQEGYFDLVLKPGEKQTLQVALTNNTAKKITVETMIASTTTNDAGQVEYGPAQTKPDESLKYNLKDYVKAPAETVIEPKATVDVKFGVDMPTAAFQGLMAGGITFQQKPSELTDSTKNQKGFAIKNQYQYIVAMLMRQQAGTVAPDLKLNGVTPSQNNTRNIIAANLQNPNMGYLNNMNVQADVKGVSDSSIHYTYHNEIMQMAPNSNFNLQVPVSQTGPLTGTYSKPLKAGKYQLAMTVYGQKDDNGKYAVKLSTGQTVNYDYKWTFDKDFTISASTAAALNAKDTSIKHPKGIAWWLYAIGAVLLVVVILLIVLLLKRRKKEDKEADKEADLQAQLKAMQEELEQVKQDKER